jgi:hypothetical protein
MTINDSVPAVTEAEGIGQAAEISADIRRALKSST